MAVLGAVLYVKRTLGYWARQECRIISIHGLGRRRASRMTGNVDGWSMLFHFDGFMNNADLDGVQRQASCFLSYSSEGLVFTMNSI